MKNITIHKKFILLAAISSISLAITLEVRFYIEKLNRDNKKKVSVKSMTASEQILQSHTGKLFVSITVAFFSTLIAYYLLHSIFDLTILV